MAKFKMPHVEVGQIVWWWYDHHTHGITPIPALVLKVADETIAVQLFEDGVQERLYRDGTRHLDDPNKNEHTIRECGVWGHTDHTKAIMKLLEAPAEIPFGPKK